MAMSIDLILPALPKIGDFFNLASSNDVQFTIGSLFLGFSFGQIFYGPISDSIGRKKAILIGYFIFATGTILCVFAPTFKLIIIGRILQGFGGAAFRICSVAIVRDKHEGREMARTMSIIMTIFVLVPVFAPAIGQLIIAFLPWKFIFVFLFLYTTTATIWMFFRMQETVTASKKIPLNFASVIKSFKIVLSDKNAMLYTACSGLAFGSMIGYINSAEQIFHNIFNVGNKFALYFALSAISIGLSSIFNALMVRKFVMKNVVKYAVLTIFFSSILFLAIMLFVTISVTIYIIYAMIVFFCFGLLFGNFNALAMQKMGRVAGTASSAIGFLSSIVSVSVGTIIGQCFNNTIFPLVIGFACLSLASFILQHFAETDL